METFKIEIQEFLSRIVEIEAENIDDAVLKVKEMYRQEEIVLSENDYITTEIEEYIE
ncbi:MAG TPA: DpnD/PcfM family protein [Chitinophagales bacterium]|nr:DpnD/PcfM family protein [Chitinophagales bacterium]HMW12995.1 DpnD/PcfM family protein [Chitinophagales bacterium]HMX60376.1 DpnD/PcfM family protein [Chitinophagales bacterium]HMY24165.1 DpnD/PcfM family protein [Chitinophagales bacterium]HMZ32861.1 DpnD/PcfM family protein [Chitinophagales bacterium]